jgi:DNA-binding CsgD family transcriptional regulator
VVPSGITVARLIRVTENSGIGAWLTISKRSGADFSDRDEQLLECLGPVLRGALQNYIALEQERFAGAVTGDAMRRLHFAWMTLDAEGHILEYDAQASRVFRFSSRLKKGAKGRLMIDPPQLKSDVFNAIERLAGKPQARPIAITISRDPWLDMLLLPIADGRLSAHPRAAIIAYVHGDSWHSADRSEQLQQLFGLSPSEARLAVALTRGSSISEAAAEFGIKVDTARKASKIIYAKSGARGLPDLIRIMMRSVLAVAPEREAQ